MPPDEKSRPAGTGRPTTTIDALPRYTGCPCGCLYDEDCVRHLPMPAPRDLSVYDVFDLGLAPHDRERCASCQAARA